MINILYFNTKLGAVRGEFYPPPLPSSPPGAFYLMTRNGKSCKFSNILLETFAPNLVSLTHPSLQILGKTHAGVFLISGLLVNPL